MALFQMALEPARSTLTRLTWQRSGVHELKWLWASLARGGFFTSAPDIWTIGPIWQVVQHSYKLVHDMHVPRATFDSFFCTLRSS